MPLPLSNGGSITISLAGYEDEHISIGSHVDGLRIADDALDSTTPGDAAVTGAFAALLGPGAYKTLDQRYVDVRLIPLRTPSGPDPAMR